MIVHVIKTMIHFFLKLKSLYLTEALSITELNYNILFFINSERDVLWSKMFFMLQLALWAYLLWWDWKLQTSYSQ